MIRNYTLGTVSIRVFLCIHLGNAGKKVIIYRLQRQECKNMQVTVSLETLPRHQKSGSPAQLNSDHGSLTLPEDAFQEVLTALNLRDTKEVVLVCLPNGDVVLRNPNLALHRALQEYGDVAHAVIRRGPHRTVSEILSAAQFQNVLETCSQEYGTMLDSLIDEEARPSASAIHSVP